MTMSLTRFTTFIQTEMCQQLCKYCHDILLCKTIHGPQRMNRTHFGDSPQAELNGDPLTFI